MPKVFVDVDLFKELIKFYNPISKSFHKKDISILLVLDKDTSIEAFDLGGPMLLPIDIDKLNENFKNQKSFYMDRTMTRYILMLMKEKGEIPKKKEA